MSEERFVVDGHERLTKTDWYREAKERITAEVGARHAAELAEAGFLRRLVLRSRMRREIARRLAEIAPPDALYLQAS